jgi:hypothetical protein
MAFAICGKLSERRANMAKPQKFPHNLWDGYLGGIHIDKIGWK